MRSAFRREFRKSSSKNHYETRLWYYDKLLFIADHKPKRHELGSKPKRELQISFDDEESMEYDEEPHQTGAQTQHLETIVPAATEVVEEASANTVVVSSQGATISTISVTPADCVALVKDENQHTHDEAAQAAAQAHQQLVAHAAAQNSITAQGHAVKVLEITSLDSNSQREIQQVGTTENLIILPLNNVNYCRRLTLWSNISSSYNTCNKLTDTRRPFPPFKSGGIIINHYLVAPAQPHTPQQLQVPRIGLTTSTMRLE